MSLNDPGKILCGIETEYGLAIEGRGPEDQIADCAEFIRGFDGKAFIGWDYRSESSRQDLRGFQVDRLATDPTDAQFDRPGSSTHVSAQLREDRILTNGARLYNDHGHPEYATSENWCPFAAAKEDRDSERIMLDLVRAYGGDAKVYKNNTDFHGASYGTHESYLVPRELGFERIYRALVPVLIARQVLTGAGKVGYESGNACDFQISQRADFFVEPANVETLYRRPIFNTRDEPHAVRNDWIRVHVISGDANRIPKNTAWKMLLVSLALRLEMEERLPRWNIADPVAAFKVVSRHPVATFSGTSATEILDYLLDEATHSIKLTDSEWAACKEMMEFLDYVALDRQKLVGHVDWATKWHLIQQYRAEVGDADLLTLQSVDLAYADIDPETSLFDALVDEFPSMLDLPETKQDLTRAWLRGIAVWMKDAWDIRNLSWESVTIGATTYRIRPDWRAPSDTPRPDDVNSYIDLLKSAAP